MIIVMVVIPEIELRLSSKGTYFWSIKVFPKAGALGVMPELEEIAKDIQAIDSKLKELFPANVTVELPGRVRVSGIDSFNED